MEELMRLRESYLSNGEIAKQEEQELEKRLPRVLRDRNPSEGTASRGHMRAYVARSVGSRSLSRAKKLANKATSAYVVCSPLWSLRRSRAAANALPPA